MDDELRKDIEIIIKGCEVIEELFNGGVTVCCCYCRESVERHHKNCVILRLQKRLENSTT